MKVLIDNIEHEADSSGYVLGIARDGKKRRVSFHNTIFSHTKSVENFKVISSGHVYVINYNPDTYKETAPLTYSDYKRQKP